MPLPVASTQYNDLKGSIALDGHTSVSDFHKLAEAKGIDTKRYFPVGISIYGTSLSAFTIYAVDTNVTKSDYDNIAKYAAAHNGVLPVVKFTFDAKWEDVKDYFKRLEIVAFRDVANLSSLDIKNEVRL